MTRFRQTAVFISCKTKFSQVYYFNLELGPLVAQMLPYEVTRVQEEVRGRDTRTSVSLEAMFSGFFEWTETFDRSIYHQLSSRSTFMGAQPGDSPGGTGVAAAGHVTSASGSSSSDGSQGEHAVTVS